MGPKVGKDLKTKAIWAIGLSFLAILIYVAVRFHELSYGLGGIVALLHDIIITFGAISILRLEFSLSLLAVILTIIGFSINDTIVIFDRVRENIKKLRKEDLPTIFNISINETPREDHPHLRYGDDGGFDPALFRRTCHPRFCSGPRDRVDLRNLLDGLRRKPRGPLVGEICYDSKKKKVEPPGPRVLTHQWIIL